MAVESAADRAVFVAGADFGTAFAWTSDGGTVALVGILDNETSDDRGGDGPGLVITEGALTLPEADLPADAAADDTLTISGADFIVRAILPDGTGMVRVTFETDRG